MARQAQSTAEPQPLPLTLLPRRKVLLTSRLRRAAIQVEVNTFIHTRPVEVFLPFTYSYRCLRSVRLSKNLGPASCGAADLLRTLAHHQNPCVLNERARLYPIAGLYMIPEGRDACEDYVLHKDEIHEGLGWQWWGVRLSARTGGLCEVLVYCSPFPPASLTTIVYPRGSLLVAFLPNPEFVDRLLRGRQGVHPAQAQPRYVYGGPRL